MGRAIAELVGYWMERQVEAVAPEVTALDGRRGRRRPLRSGSVGPTLSSGDPPTEGVAEMNVKLARKVPARASVRGLIVPSDRLASSGRDKRQLGRLGFKGRDRLGRRLARRRQGSRGVGGRRPLGRDVGRRFPQGRGNLLAAVPSAPERGARRVGGDRRGIGRARGRGPRLGGGRGHRRVPVSHPQGRRRARADVSDHRGDRNLGRRRRALGRSRRRRGGLVRPRPGQRARWRGDAHRVRGSRR